MQCNDIETIEPINTDTLKCTLNALGWTVVDFEKADNKKLLTLTKMFLSSFQPHCDRFKTLFKKMKN